MKQILCFGDSNTYGLVPGTDKRYGWGIRWTSKLEEKVRAKGYRVIEEGLCGRTAAFEDPIRSGRNGSALLPVILESHRPVEFVIVMLGTNDCKSAFHASPEIIGDGIRILIEQVRHENPRIQILLISPIWLRDGVGEEGYDPDFNEKSVWTSRELKAVYQNLAKRYGCSFLAASDYVKASEADREHLDEKGHSLLADAVFYKVEQAWKDKEDDILYERYGIA